MLELIAIVIALTLLNSFFAMSEMALMTSRKLKLKQMGERSRGARKALALAEHPDNLLSTVQIGITLITLLTGMLGGDSLGLLIATWLQGASWLQSVVPGQYAALIGKAVAVGLITAFSVIFGELVPKRLALTNPEAIASRVAIPLDMLSRFTKPIVRALGAINRGVLRILGIRDDGHNAITEEEIQLLVSESHEQGVIDDDERNMMQRVMRLGDRTVESMMTPRTRIVWLDTTASFEDNLAEMRATPYSRYPVYRGSDADVAGVLEAKSLLDRFDDHAPDLFKNLRSALYVSESTHALKLLEIFREEQQSLALVVDEYGDITGMVTVNDLMGAVVGRVQSGETQDSEALVIHRDDGSILVDGSLPVDELRELIGQRLPNEDDHDYHTAAGMAIAQFGRIPNTGEYFVWSGWRIDVVDLDGPRVDKLLITPIESATESNED